MSQYYRIDHSKLKRAVRYYRVSKELTQEKFCLDCEIETASLIRILQGKTKDPNINTIVKICDVLGVTDVREFMIKVI